MPIIFLRSCSVTYTWMAQYDRSHWPITLTMVIDCWFFTNHLCWVRLYDCPETEPTCKLHTRYIHTETHTWNTRTYKKLRHTSYKCLDIKIFKSIIYIYSNTQQQTPVLKVIWAHFFTTYFCFIWHDEAILNNISWQYNSQPKARAKNRHLSWHDGAILNDFTEQDSQTKAWARNRHLSWHIDRRPVVTRAHSPGVFSTRVGDVLMCSPHGWAMSWCVLHTGGRCPGVFSTRVGDVLVCSPHGWVISWCVLHTGGWCPGVFSTHVGDIQGDCTWQPLTSALYTAHLAGLQWSRLDTGLPNDRTPFTH